MGTWLRSSWRRLLPLGSLLVAFTSGCDQRLEPQGQPPELLRRVAAPVDATPVAVDIDDQRPLFLVAGMRGPIQVWNEGSGEPANIATAPSSAAVIAARFATGGVFFALEQGTVTLWSEQAQRALFTHEFSTSNRQAALSGNGRYVAFGGSVLELASQRMIGKAKPLATQSALAFSANGERVVSAGFQEPWIVVRDLLSGAVREWIAPGKVSQAVLSPSGDLVAAAMRNGEIHFWRQPGGEAVGSWQGPDEVRALCFLPPGAFLVDADPGGFSVVDVTHLRRTWRANVEGTLWSFACDGDLVAAGNTEGQLWLWDVARQVLRARLRLSSSAVTALDISAARQRLAAADEKGNAVIWGWR
jgi:WD40 repeat protein